MTKREFKYLRAKKVDRFWGKLFNAASAYQVTLLKIQQLKYKMLQPSEQLESYLKFTEMELEKQLNP